MQTHLPYDHAVVCQPSRSARALISPRKFSASTATGSPLDDIEVVIEEMRCEPLALICAGMLVVQWPIW